MLSKSIDQKESCPIKGTIPYIRGVPWLTDPLATTLHLLHHRVSQLLSCLLVYLNFLSLEFCLKTFFCKDTRFTYMSMISMELEQIRTMTSTMNCTQNQTGNQYYLHHGKTLLYCTSEGNDPTHPQSYRLLSLLNIEYKLFMTILAKRLNNLVAYIMHSVQIGLVLKRYMTGEVRYIVFWMTLMILFAMQEDIIIFLDAENAFDSWRWTAVEIFKSWIQSI